MAGHRRERGDDIALTSRHSQRSERLFRATAAARTATDRAVLAFDYLRAELAATDRRHRPAATEVADRAAVALRGLADELYQAAIKERRASR